MNVALTSPTRRSHGEGEVRFEVATAELMKRPDILRAVYFRDRFAYHALSAGRRSARSQELELARPILEVNDS